MAKLSIDELERILDEKKKINKKKKRKRMKTEKKALLAGMTVAITLIIFSMVMVVLDKDTQTTAIFGGAGVAIIPFMFGIYKHHSTKINLVHMEKNYIEDYDEKEGIY